MSKYRVLVVIDEEGVRTPDLSQIPKIATLGSLLAALPETQDETFYICK